MRNKDKREEVFRSYINSSNTERNTIDLVIDIVDTLEYIEELEAELGKYKRISSLWFNKSLGKSRIEQTGTGLVKGNKELGILKVASVVDKRGRIAGEINGK